MNMDKKVLLDERTGELKAIEKQLNDTTIGITDYDEFHAQIEGVIVGLDTGVRHELEEASMLIKEIERLKSFPSMQGQDWKDDPWLEVAESYDTVSERLLKATAFKSWIIRFLDLENKKILNLVKSQSKEFVGHQKLRVEKDMFDRFIGEMGKQMEAERKMYEKSVNRRIDDLTEKVNDIARKINISPLPLREERKEETKKEEEEEEESPFKKEEQVNT